MKKDPELKDRAMKTETPPLDMGETHATEDAEEASRNRLLSHLQRNTDARLAEKLARAEDQVRKSTRPRAAAG